MHACNLVGDLGRLAARHLLGIEPDVLREHAPAVRFQLRQCRRTTVLRRSYGYDFESLPIPKSSITHPPPLPESVARDFAVFRVKAKLRPLHNVSIHEVRFPESRNAGTFLEIEDFYQSRFQNKDMLGSKPRIPPSLLRELCLKDLAGCRRSQAGSQASPGHRGSHDSIV